MDSAKWSNYSNIGTFFLTTVILLIMVIPLLWSGSGAPASDPASTHPTSAQSPAEPRRTVVIAWIMPSVLALAVLGAAVLNFAASRQRKTKSTIIESAPRTLGGAVSIQPVPWHAKMIEDDRGKLGQRVLAVKWMPFRFFEATAPYIDFDITFTNGTVFDFDKPETIKGTAKFRNQPLPNDPKFVSSFPLPHGDKTWMKIRQHVTPEIAEQMKIAISSHQPTVLDFSEVRIPIKGHCNGVAQASFEWAGAPEVSFNGVTTI